jgi:hypothetical protein
MAIAQLEDNWSKSLRSDGTSSLVLSSGTSGCTGESGICDIMSRCMLWMPASPLNEPCILMMSVTCSQ